MARTGRPPVAQKITRTCEHCGAHWEAYPSHGDKTKYCSRQCYFAAKTGIPTKPKEDHAIEARNCERCDAPFFVGGADHPVRTTRFCGRVCAKSAFWESHKAAGTDISRPDMNGVPKPALWIEPEQKACPWCGNTFLVGGSGKSRDKLYCGRSCARRAMWAGRRDGSIAPLPISHASARDMTVAESMWFAGVFDGEGCVSWPHRTDKWQANASLSVSNTSMALLDRIVEVTGTGRITVRGRQDQPHHAPCWVWNCNGANARRVLEQVVPYLIVKKQAAEFALVGERGVQPPIAPRNRHKRKQQPEDENGRLL